MANPTDYNPDEWELIHDEGFVYKRKKCRLDPTAYARAPDPEPDPALVIQERQDRKRKALLQLKEKYQKEISLWDNLSNSFKAMEERAKTNVGEVEKVGEMSTQRVESEFSVENCSGSLLDQLLGQVEAQEAIIQGISHLCDVAESLCSVQEEKAKQYFFDLPIWGSPRELMASLCED